MAPVLSSATHTGGTVITATFSESLLSGALPATTDFNVTVNGTGRTINSVSVSGAQCQLTLASSVTSSDTVLVSYTNPAQVVPPTSPGNNYTIPGTFTSVSNSAQLLSALGSGTATNIVLQGTVGSPITYDNASAFSVGGNHKIYAANYGGAILTAGLNIGNRTGVEVHGLTFNVTSSSKLAANNAIIGVWGSSSGTILTDCYLDGGSSRTPYGCIMAYAPAGLVVQRMVLRNAFGFGIRASTNPSTSDVTIDRIEDLFIENVYHTNRGNDDGRSEVGVTPGHQVANGISRIKIRNCGWMGISPNNKCKNTTFRDIDIDDIFGFVPTAGAGTTPSNTETGIAVYVERKTDNLIFERFDFGTNMYTGFNGEWHGGTIGNAAMNNFTARNGRVRGNRVQPNEGQISTRNGQIIATRRTGYYGDHGSTFLFNNDIVFLNTNWGCSGWDNRDDGGTTSAANFHHNDYSQRVSGTTRIFRSHINTSPQTEFSAGDGLLPRRLLGTTNAREDVASFTNVQATSQGVSLPARIAEWEGTGTTYYVDSATGNDNRTAIEAQNESTPWASLQKAVDTYALPASGHVRVLVKNGNGYRGPASTSATANTVSFSSLGTRSPTSTKVLHVLAYPGHNPIVQEPAYTGSTPATAIRRAFYMNDSSAKFIRIRGFKLVCASPGTVQQTQAMSIHGGTDIEVDQCEAYGWASGAYASARSQGFYSDTASNRIHFYNLKVHDIGNPAVEAANLSHGFYIQGSNKYLVNILSYDNRNGFGIQFYDGSSSGGGTGHIVSHVLLANNKMSGMVVDGSGYIVTVRNSIFYDNDQSAISGRNGSTTTAHYCIAYLNGAGPYSVEGGATIGQANNLTSNPSLVNFAVRDFHLNSGSPAYNSGVIEYTPFVDLDTNTRTVSTRGAYRAPEESLSRSAQATWIEMEVPTTSVVNVRRSTAVQSNIDVGSIAVSPSGGTTANDSLIALIHIVSATESVSSVTDNTGGTWTRDNFVQSVSGNRLEVWRRHNASVVSTVTATLTAPRPVGISLAEVTGLASQTPVQTNTASGSSSSVMSGSVQPAVPYFAVGMTYTLGDPAYYDLVDGFSALQSPRNTTIKSRAAWRINSANVATNIGWNREGVGDFQGVIVAYTTAPTSTHAQDIRVRGSIPSTRTNEIRISSNVPVVVGVDVKTRGQAIAARDQDVRIRGRADTSQLAEIRVTGKASIEAAQDIRATGGLTPGTTIQDIRVRGHIITSTDASVRATASSVSSDNRVTRITARADTTYDTLVLVSGVITSADSFGIRIIGAPSRIARPVEDTFVGGWTAVPSGTLTSVLDEIVPDDSDYTRSSVQPVDDAFEVRLSGLETPAARTGHLVQYRIGKANNSTVMKMTVQLVQGANIIASWTHSDVPSILTTFSQSLTQVQAEAITDYFNLSMRVIARTSLDSDYSQNVKATGQSSSVQFNDVRLTARGETADNRGVRTIARADTYISQEIKTSGGIPSNTVQDIRTRGQATTTNERDIRIVAGGTIGSGTIGDGTIGG